VKAMGVDLRGRNLAQVSMNLTDFECTPIHRAFEEVKREAERHSVGIEGSEIVGLVPRRALEITADYFLKLENFSSDQVLENRLEESLGSQAKNQRTLAALAEPFLDAIARPTPAPGGGSVAALAGALGASLGQMVAGLSRRKKSLAAHAEALKVAADEFRTAAGALAAAIDRDAASYEAVIAAHRLPRQTPEDIRRGDAAVQPALAGAIEVPLDVAREAANVFARLGHLETVAPHSMVSDVRVGRMMAATAVRGALENVATNLESITDASFASRIQAESRLLMSRIRESSDPARR